MPTAHLFPDQIQPFLHWWQVRGVIVDAKVSTFNKPKAHCISSQQLLQGCFRTLHVLKLFTIFSSKGTSTSCPFRYVLSRSLTLSIRLELFPLSTKCWNTCSFHDKLESWSKYKSPIRGSWRVKAHLIHRIRTRSLYPEPVQITKQSVEMGHIRAENAPLGPVEI